MLHVKQHNNQYTCSFYHNHSLHEKIFEPLAQRQILQAHYSLFGIFY